MSTARSFHIAFALGRGCEPAMALRFARYASRQTRRLSAAELFEDWFNLQHVADVEFALYGTHLTGMAS